MTVLVAQPLRLRLPATSANLGPGFDALGLAMALYLEIRAESSLVFHIEASGRDAALCADTETSLILTTYRNLLGPAALPLTLKLHNEIPLGMGCGSSAAALLAGVLLANHFGRLGWSGQEVVEEACRREGHPDNVAACFYGGMTSSACLQRGDGGVKVVTATCGRDLRWRLLLALPGAGLATAKARALLPATYARTDAVANVQATALLVSAFALDRPDLLRYAMRDRLHQPFRMEVCPLLSRLLPLLDESSGTGIYGVALSGAGPAVLLIAAAEANVDLLIGGIRSHSEDSSLEVISATIAGGFRDDPLCSPSLTL